MSDANRQKMCKISLILVRSVCGEASPGSMEAAWCSGAELKLAHSGSPVPDASEPSSRWHGGEQSMGGV